MALTETQLRSCFSPTDLARGKDYFERGRVLRFQQMSMNGRSYASALVQGTEMYEVEVLEYPNGRLGGYCSCPRFEETGSCKHLAAVCLMKLERQEEVLSTQSDARIAKLLSDYLEQDRHVDPSEESGSVRLYPTFVPVYASDEYPAMTMRVGRERPYVVKNVKEFLEAVESAATVTYGKQLSFRHSMDQFDPGAQALIRLLLEEAPPFCTLNRSAWSRTAGQGGAALQKEQVLWQRGAFDRLFQVLLDYDIPINICGSEGRAMEQDPPVRVTLTPERDGAKLTVKLPGDHRFFGSSRVLYAYGPEGIFRCGKTFQQEVYPLIRAVSSGAWVAPQDLPTFCAGILQDVQGMVELVDPEGIRQKSLPDECTPCFWFDWQDEALTARLSFRYGDTELRWGEAMEGAKVKRDLRTEQTAIQALTRYFPSEPPLVLTGDGAYDFLVGPMDGLRTVGEVYVTDRLRGKRVTAAGVKVGVSVSNGLLNLDLDTGDFPPEELEALYQSLLLKRTYHRLRDGRYLALDGSACETLAELTHMTQLTAKDLAKGHATLPAFRALYLDGVLSGGRGLEVTRDRQFRAMIRQFKSVAESDDAVPGQLETVLRPYQKVGFRWLKTLERCGFGGILADEMGLGKTVQVIAFLCTATRRLTGLPSLVVCPASLILNWSDELTRFAPELKPLLLMGTAQERKEQMEDRGEADVWVTSYDLLKRDIELYQGRKFYCCILDEAQNIKNQSTQASKSVKRIDCKQRFVLTGTPIENRLSELWNLFDFLMPGYLFSHNAFVEKLEKPVVQSQDAEAAMQLRKLVQPFLLRRLKQDVLKELPPKVERVRRVSLSESERKVYLATAAAARSELAGGDQGKLAILAALTRLRQICCDPNLCFENYEGETRKLEACLELCQGMTENGHQILLFSQFPTMLARIRQRLDRMGISSFTLQGSTPKEQRAQLVKDFNQGGAQVFLISLKAGGTGLNLTAADVVIHYDPWWNQAAQNQATDRAHRIGQQSSVQVYKLIAKDTIEEKILELQSRKAALMDAISGENEESILSMSKEDLLALLEIGAK